MAFDFSPAWSSDGSKIVFESERDGDREVYVMEADETNQVRRLTNRLGFDGRPVWSPDGSQIAFHSGRDGNFEVYVMDADGGNPTNLTNNPAGDAGPAWSPRP